MRDETVRRYLRARSESGRWYALCGSRLYMIATLAGTFPDTGWHVPDEMGGVWAPPIKLLDGYWLGFRADGHEPHWLTNADDWQRAADGVTLSYTLPALGLEVTRRDWIVPNESVLVLDVRIARALDTTAPNTSALACGLALRSDLRGNWLSEERLGLADGEDVATYHDELRAVTVRDFLHPEWMVCVGAAAGPAAINRAPRTYALGQSVWGPERTAGRGTGAALWYPIDAGDVSSAALRFVIAGPGRDGEPATSVFSRYARPSREAPHGHDASSGVSAPSAPLERAHRASAEAFHAAFDHCALNSPNPLLNEAFGWAKVSTADLMLDIPDLGRAPMGGLPDYPWWFGCDVAYGVLPMLPAGQGTNAADALRTLAGLSQRYNGNGRVVHEVVSNGVVTWGGNLVETLLLARALYHTYHWTGDRSLLDDLFPFCLDGVLRYTLGERMAPGEHVPQGESMAETPDAHGGVQTLDVGAYCAEALDLLGALAEARRDVALAGEVRARADGIRRHMREEWWLPEQDVFGDLRASRTEMETMLRRFETMAAPDDSVMLSIRRLRDALAEPDDCSPDERRPWLFMHYVQALATEAGLPTREQADALLARLETPEWTEPHGLVLNATTDRRIMSLPTSAMAVAEARYGRMDAALDYIERLISTYGAATPGMISEFSPDGGCFQQLWSSYGVVWPIVHAFFGLRPDVAARRLVCVPQLPAAWPSARLTRIPLGDTWANVSVERTEGGQRLTLEIGDPGWEVTLGAAGAVCLPLAECALNLLPAALRPGHLAERDERGLWLAPAASGSAHYTLDIVWSSVGTATCRSLGGRCATGSHADNIHV